MANQANWDYSQKYSGGLLAIFGISLLIICVVINDVELNVDNDAGNLIVGSIITTINCVDRERPNKAF